MYLPLKSSSHFHLFPRLGFPDCTSLLSFFLLGNYFKRKGIRFFFINHFQIF